HTFLQNDSMSLKGFIAIAPLGHLVGRIKFDLVRSVRPERMVIFFNAIMNVHHKANSTSGFQKTLSKFWTLSFITFTPSFSSNSCISVGEEKCPFPVNNP